MTWCFFFSFSAEVEEDKEQQDFPEEVDTIEDDITKDAEENNPGTVAF